MRHFIQDLVPAFPEIVLLSMTAFSLLFAVYAPPSKAKAYADKCVYAGLLTAFFILCFMDVPEKGVFVGESSFILDGFSLYLKKIVLVGAFVCLMFATEWLRYKKYSRFEFAPLLGFSVTGMMLTLSGKTFLMQFLGLEMIHFPLLFLTAYKRMGDRSTEAGTKYAVTVFLSSGLYLFGVSVIYACLGTLDFSKIATADKTQIMPALLWGLSFITAGLFIKIGVVPFHSWMADIYEGAPSPVTALFVTIVRLGVIAALARIVWYPFAGLDFYLHPVLLATALLSVCIGSFGAMVQDNIKRLTAYTAIVLNGFAMAALMSKNVALLLMNLSVDLVLTAGAAAILLSLRLGDALSEQIRVLAGQGRVKPVRGALFSLIFLGLAGAPPFAGFWGRLALFKEMSVAGAPIIAALLMSAGLLIMYVYFSLIRQMYAVSAKEELSLAPSPMKAIIVFAAFISVFFFTFAEPLRIVWKSATLGGG